MGLAFATNFSLVHVPEQIAAKLKVLPVHLGSDSAPKGALVVEAVSKERHQGSKQ